MFRHLLYLENYSLGSQTWSSPRGSPTESSDLLKGEPKGQGPGRHPEPTGDESFVQAEKPLVLNGLDKTIQRALVGGTCKKRKL